MDEYHRSQHGSARSLSQMIIAALVLGGCSSSAESLSEGTVGELQTSIEATPLSEPSGDESADDDALGALRASDLPEGNWADQVFEAYQQLQLGRAAADEAWIEASMSGGDEIEKATSFLGAEHEVLNEFLASLPGVPANSQFAASYRSVVELVLRIIESNRGMLTLIEDDTDGIRLDVEAAESPGETAYGRAFSSHWALDDQLLDLCSAMQTDLSPFGVLDCAGSTVDRGDIAEEQGIDPTTTATGQVTWATLAPGRHDFEVFEPGLVLDLADSVLVQSGRDFLVFGDPEDDKIEFWMFAADEWSNPDELAGFDDDFAGIPIPIDDVDAYLNRLPVAVSDSGIVNAGGQDVRFWDFGIDESAAASTLEFPEFPLLKLGPGPGDPLLLVFPEATHRLMLWDSVDGGPVTGWYFFRDGDEAAAGAAFFLRIMESRE